MTNQMDSKKVVTGIVRLSYCHLTQPRSNQGGTPKYSVTLLIPKSDVTTKAKIDAAINAAIQEGITTKWNGIKPAQTPAPLYDGDGVRPTGEPFGAECRGCWVMTASCAQKPRVVDANINEIMDATQIYSGMYGRVSLRFFPYFSVGKKGIGCGLNNVQKTADGEPLGGISNPEDDFNTPPAGYAPQQPAYAQQPTYPQQIQAPAYPQQPVYPQQSVYSQQRATIPQQPQPIDPITGKPAIGPIYGVNNNEVPFL